MAEKFYSDSDNNLIPAVPTELSKDDDDITEYIHFNSLEALKARFGSAEEDENIRKQGFELAKPSGLIRKSRPESGIAFSDTDIKKNDINTDSDTELSKVFDSAKSEHDNDNVTFSDLELNSTDEEKYKKPEEKAEPDKPAEKKTKTVVIDEDSDEEVTQIVRKYNTHTKVIFSDESLDDGIKRNSDSELEGLFDNAEKGRKSRLWSRKKK